MVLAAAICFSMSTVEVGDIGEVLSAGDAGELVPDSRVACKMMLTLFDARSCASSF